MAARHSSDDGSEEYDLEKGASKMLREAYFEKQKRDKLKKKLVKVNLN